jgi:hypothetical protein
VATYDGVNIFGQSVKCRMVVNPSAAQIDAFFGANGQQSLFGGGRGRTFLIEGVLTATDVPTLNSMYGLILSYDDGIGRILVDSLGNTWPNVVFRRFEPAERILPGPVLPYKVQFDGLT